MANDLTSNPLYIDTAGTSAVLQGGRIKAIVWSSIEGNVIAAAADLDIRLGNSTSTADVLLTKRIALGSSQASLGWSLEAELAIERPMFVRTLDSGVLYIYME